MLTNSGIDAIYIDICILLFIPTLKATQQLVPEIIFIMHVCLTYDAWDLVGMRCLSASKKNIKPHFWHLFLRYCKNIANCYFEYFENAWSCPSIMVISTCRMIDTKVLKSTYIKLWCLCTCKKLTSSITSFLRYCKDIANLLFWELWECLTIPIKIIVSICSKLSCLSACRESTSSLTSFLRYILQINSKYVILGNLGITGHTHLKW